MAKLDNLRSMNPALSLFDPLGPWHQPVLQRFIGEYDALRMPLFGYLFRGSKVWELNARVSQELPCTNSLGLHERLRDLRIAHDSLVVIKQTLAKDRLTDAVGEVVYRILLSDSECCADAEVIRHLLETFAKVVGNDEDLLNSLAVDGETFQTAGELLCFVVQALRYMLLWRKVGRTLASAPAFDYVGSNAKLEHLHTTRMTHEIDRRFVEFVEQSRTTAKTLGDVIKAKQRLPQEAFARLKEAFPCIIADIREFAEYLPLQHAIFDAVVIDEASQVSVAQAFPALLRAKKVVVLGDQKQFSNVKAAHASIARNQGYLTDLDQYFREHISNATNKIQRLKTKLIVADTYADRFEEDLRLKIMTFDTCRGEERDVIFYSMVATATNDALNYIFPVNLENSKERVEEVLKVQRLNVGFSRAREKIHFILSKAVEQYPGVIGRVLMHYRTLLEDRTVPEADETDPNSPMERKVLDWIPKTSFYQHNAERLELRAQFPVGDYLRQLDPTYKHPAYRCDFLLCYRDNDRTINIILEYDGFQEHFTDHNHIHLGNYNAYYRPEDIERQMVLESYGYKFLRINRFNLGNDPVATLSDRLYALIEAATQERDLR